MFGSSALWTDYPARIQRLIELAIGRDWKSLTMNPRSPGSVNDLDMCSSLPLSDNFQANLVYSLQPLWSVLFAVVLLKVGGPRRKATRMA